jgi:hypothetical protein
MSHVYLGGGFTSCTELTRSVFKYSITNDSWSILPITPCHTFGLVIIDNMVTIIGGTNVITGLLSKDLFSYIEVGSNGKWCSIVPPMGKRRSCCSAIRSGKYVIIVGGVSKEDTNEYERSVEVYNVETKRWSYGSPCIKPNIFMSIASLGDQLYLTGGLTPEGGAKDVYTCSVSDLVGNDSSAWRVLCQAPYQRSACCVIQGTLVVFGGLGKSSESTQVQSDIHAWNESDKKWRKLGDLPAKRSSSTAVVTGWNRVMILGGYNNPVNWVKSLLSEAVEVVNVTVTNPGS